MSIVTRKRNDSYAIVPNAVANDDRLTFEERGLLVYLLAKPHDWKISIANIRAEGGVGRDKVYRMLKHLAETGYVKAEQTKRADGTFGQTDYTVYDDAVPDRLPLDEPLPEKSEAVRPLPESQDTVKPLPEKPDTETPDTENQEAYKELKETNIPPLPPSAPAARFDEIVHLWPGDCIGRPAMAHRAWEKLSSQQQQAAFECVKACVTAYRRRGKPVPKLADYLGGLWAEFHDGPEIDEKGRFRITSARAEWPEWLGDLRRTYGESAVNDAVKRGFVLRETRWPPAAPTAAAKRAATMEAACPP